MQLITKFGFVLMVLITLAAQANPTLDKAVQSGVTAGDMNFDDQATIFKNATGVDATASGSIDGIVDATVTYRGKRKIRCRVGQDAYVAARSILVENCGYTADPVQVHSMELKICDKGQYGQACTSGDYQGPVLVMANTPLDWNSHTFYLSCLPGDMYCTLDLTVTDDVGRDYSQLEQELLDEVAAGGTEGLITELKAMFDGSYFDDSLGSGTEGKMIDCMEDMAAALEAGDPVMSCDPANPVSVNVGNIAEECELATEWTETCDGTVPTQIITCGTDEQECKYDFRYDDLACQPTTLWDLVRNGNSNCTIGAWTQIYADPSLFFDECGPVRREVYYMCDPDRAETNKELEIRLCAQSDTELNCAPYIIDLTVEPNIDFLMTPWREYSTKYKCHYWGGILSGNKYPEYNLVLQGKVQCPTDGMADGKECQFAFNDYKTNPTTWQISQDPMQGYDKAAVNWNRDCVRQEYLCDEFNCWYECQDWDAIYTTVSIPDDHIPATVPMNWFSGEDGIQEGQYNERPHACGVPAAPPSQSCVFWLTGTVCTDTTVPYTEQCVQTYQESIGTVCTGTYSMAVWSGWSYMQSQQPSICQEDFYREYTCPNGSYIHTNDEGWKIDAVIKYNDDTWEWSIVNQGSAGFRLNEVRKADACGGGWGYDRRGEFTNRVSGTFDLPHWHTVPEFRYDESQCIPAQNIVVDPSTLL